jgi:glyoxalase-like protein
VYVPWMLLGIDHIVIAVRDPDAAAERITDEVGLAAGGGGRHPRFGTFNRLIWLGDSYLELMGVADPELARGRSVGAAVLQLLERGEEGFASFAVASDSLPRDVVELRELGAPYEDPKPGERERPDGEIVRWLTALPDQLGPDSLPFLIEHRYEGAEWGPEARADRAEVVHPFGGKATLGRLEIAVRQPAAAASRYHDGVGLAVLPEVDGSIDLPVGPNLIRFVPPSTADPPATIAIDGTAGQPRSVDILGCRFLVEVATLGSEKA